MLVKGMCLRNTTQIQTFHMKTMHVILQDINSLRPMDTLHQHIMVLLMFTYTYQFTNNDVMVIVNCTQEVSK